MTRIVFQPIWTNLFCRTSDGVDPGRLPWYHVESQDRDKDPWEPIKEHSAAVDSMETRFSSEWGHIYARVHYIEPPTTRWPMNRNLLNNVPHGDFRRTIRKLRNEQGGGNRPSFLEVAGFLPGHMTPLGGGEFRLEPRDTERLPTSAASKADSECAETAMVSLSSSASDLPSLHGVNFGSDKDDDDDDDISCVSCAPQYCIKSIFRSLDFDDERGRPGSRRDFYWRGPQSFR